jgi:hypothetical protein
MTSHPLDGAFERINRADEHIEELKDLINAINRIYHDAVIIEINPKTSKLEPIVKSRLNLPSIKTGIVIGEICYNLRAALDYLVYELARRDGTIKERTQFPLSISPDGWGREKKALLKAGIDPCHIATIESLQPYNGCKWTNALARVSNSDKHRVIQVHTGVYIASLRIGKGTVVAGDFRVTSVRRAKMPDGSEVDVNLTTSVDVGLPVRITPTFREAGPAIDTLHEIKTEVAIDPAQ